MQEDMLKKRRKIMDSLSQTISKTEFAFLKDQILQAENEKENEVIVLPEIKNSFTQNPPTQEHQSSRNRTKIKSIQSVTDYKLFCQSQSVRKVRKIQSNLQF